MAATPPRRARSRIVFARVVGFERQRDAELRAEREQQRRKLEADAAQMDAERKNVALQRQERANLKQRPSLRLRSPPLTLMLTTMLTPTPPRR